MPEHFRMPGLTDLRYMSWTTKADLLLNFKKKAFIANLVVTVLHISMLGILTVKFMRSLFCSTDALKL